MVSAPLAAPEADLDRAYRTCARIAQRHDENFPVASLLLPKRMRPAIAAIYAFARRADDFADEPGPDDTERIRLLADWSQRLRACGGSETKPEATNHEPGNHERGNHEGGNHEGGNHEGGNHENASHESGIDDLIFVALADTIRRHRLPIRLFEDLLSAFRQDVTTRRYASWTDVLDYCSRSANPVGRLVLRVAGHDDPLLDQQSDALCTALQLTNFWQDFGVDWRRGRLYLPEDDRERAGADQRDLDARRWTPEWRSAMDTVVARTRQLFVVGRPLCDIVRGRLRWELRLTWLGGSRTLDKVQRTDVLNHRPRLTLLDLPTLAGRTAIWR